MMSASSQRWTMGQILCWLMGLVAFVALSVFLALTLMRHFPNAEALWSASSQLFILLGVMLAGGVGFAVLAMAVAYLSLNHKLDLAHSHLAQARLLLDDHKNQARETTQIQQQVYELVSHYESLSEHPHVSEVHYLHKLIKQILSSEFADFEARLIARAVQHDWQAKQGLQQAQSQPTEALWQKNQYQWQQAAFLWQSISLASPEFLQLGQQRRFLAAQFHQAHALQSLAQLNGMTRQPEYYRQLHALYLPLLLSEKSHDDQINQMINEAAYQSGVQTYQEGEYWWQLGSQNFAQVRKKWADAQLAFKKALEMHPNDSESAAQWGHLLEREARLVAQSDANKLSEARKLWLAAREKYRMVLDMDKQRADAAFNWGNTFSDEATALIQTDGARLGEARVLWQSARERYEQTIEINRQFDAAHHQTGMTFNKEADAVLHIQQSTDEARYLWKSAGEHFQAALDINPARFETANSWGLVLAKEADLLVQLSSEHVPEAKRLWQLAQQRFHRALEIEPTLQAASANWRTILSHELNVLSPEEASNLLNETHEKVLALQQISPAHQQSNVIADLASFVKQALNKHAPSPSDNGAHLQPPEFRPITRNETL